ncbi:MAG TPA: ABC transporter permease [Spirochaetota bacterium]|nr:ABC transporter permease [Spirochaetota bacterium]
MRSIKLRPAVLKSLIVKEFKQILRDKKMKAMLFGSPVLMLLIFGYAVNTDISEIKMVVLDGDKSSESRELLRKFTASGYFTHYASLESPDEAAYYIDRGEADMFMHIPQDFKKNLLSGKSAELQIILDGTDSSRASVIMAYINQISSDFSLEYLSKKIRMIILSRENTVIRLKESLPVKERVMFNPDLTSRNFYLPGVLGLLVALITIMLTSMSVVKERESGTIEQIIVSPLRSSEFIAGKTLPFAIIGIVEICVITLIAIAWFRVPFNGSFIFLIFSSIFYIVCTLSVGLFISTISQTQQQAMLSTFLFFIPAILLSGFVFPIYAMPEIFQYITFLNPMRYFMTIIRGIFLKGVGFTVLWTELLSLAILGSVLISLSIRRFNRRFE